MEGKVGVVDQRVPRLSLFLSPLHWGLIVASIIGAVNADDFYDFPNSYYWSGGGNYGGEASSGSFNNPFSPQNAYGSSPYERNEQEYVAYDGPSFLPRPPTSLPFRSLDSEYGGNIYPNSGYTDEGQQGAPDGTDHTRFPTLIPPNRIRPTEIEVTEPSLAANGEIWNGNGNEGGGGREMAVWGGEEGGDMDRGQVKDVSLIRNIPPVFGSTRNGPMNGMVGNEMGWNGGGESSCFGSGCSSSFKNENSAYLGGDGGYEFPIEEEGGAGFGAQTQQQGGEFGGYGPNGIMSGNGMSSYVAPNDNNNFVGAAGNGMMVGSRFGGNTGGTEDSEEMGDEGTEVNGGGMAGLERTGAGANWVPVVPMAQQIGNNNNHQEQQQRYAQYLAMLNQKYGVGMPIGQMAGGSVSPSVGDQKSTFSGQNVARLWVGVNSVSPGMGVALGANSLAGQSKGNAQTAIHSSSFPCPIPLTSQLTDIVAGTEKGTTINGCPFVNNSVPRPDLERNGQGQGLITNGVITGGSAPFSSSKFIGAPQVQDGTASKERMAVGERPNKRQNLYGSGLLGGWNPQPSFPTASVDSPPPMSNGGVYGSNGGHVDLPYPFGTTTTTTSPAVPFMGQLYGQMNNQRVGGWTSGLTPVTSFFGTNSGKGNMMSGQIENAAVSQQQQLTAPLLQQLVALLSNVNAATTTTATIKPVTTTTMTTRTTQISTAITTAAAEQQMPMQLSTTSVQALTQQIRRLPAVLYVDSRKMDSRRLETLLRDTYGLPLVTFYVDKIDRPETVESNLEQLTAHRGLPYLFICGTFIGSDEHIQSYHDQRQIPQLVEYVCKGDSEKTQGGTTKGTEKRRKQQRETKSGRKDQMKKRVGREKDNAVGGKRLRRKPDKKRSAKLHKI